MQRSRCRRMPQHCSVARLTALMGLAALAAIPLGARAAPGYLTHPDLHLDLVVFTAEGDLWLASIEGGSARRLTSHPGDEILPRFSPDGRSIAFTAEYDGNSDLFVIATSGGEPRRLTWHPSGDFAVGWTPDGSRILLRSARESPFDTEIYSIPAEGGDPEIVPIGRANLLDIDPVSGRYAFTRTWGGGTWKRYRGGTAPEIWVGDPDRADFAEVTRFDGIDLYPMWNGGRIYFLSDQGGTANLWSILPDGTDRTRHTEFDRWDARSPAMAPDGRIVFTLAGDIHLFDPASNGTRKLPIDLPSERVLTRVRYPDATPYITEATLSPDGERIAVVARGEIFSVPAKDGVTLPVTRGSGAREDRAAYSHDGTRIFYFTDENGEMALVSADAWGRGDPRVVKPSGATGWYHRPSPSPDGKWVAYADMTHRLYVAPSAGGTPIEVDRSPQTEITEYVWSPDGRWLAYTKRNQLGYGSISIFDAKERKSHSVTGSTTDDSSPAWDPKGRYLSFLSNRTINPIIDTIDFETAVVQSSKPYLVLLRGDVENPFLPLKGTPPKGSPSDSKGKKPKKGAEEEPDDPPAPIAIEIAGIGDRVVEAPVEPGTYSDLSADGSGLFYLSHPLIGLNEISVWEEEPKPQATLIKFDFEKKEAKPFLSGLVGYELRPKAGKILASKGKGELYRIDAATAPEDDISEAKVPLEGIVIELDPREEWRQIFVEGWRSMRDFYWDETMSRIDWPAVRDQYASLLPRLATRSDLRDLMAEMIGELSTSHTYTWGGDMGREPSRLANGLLGARFVREGTAYRVERILRGDPADGVRSPLREPGAMVEEGDYILAVNHRPFRPDRPFEAALENLAEKKVLLTVNSRPTREGARDLVVRPLSSESDLLYADWVRRNRERVSRETGGKIGYVHIPDMMGRGLTEFDRWFYPQLDKEGMIIDCRWNGGGFVSQLILARLQRRILSWDRTRWGAVWSYPYRSMKGPFVVLTNEEAGSDGDILPAAVQLAGLAPVIGKRSWGGVVGIRGGRPFVDGGMITHPESAWWDSRRGWSLEGRGVDPDIEADNLPQEIARGIDAQLDRGIQEVLRLHAERPPARPSFGPAPDRRREAYREER